ncbi:hypothetical protein SAY87_016465 [Trapa incisa]|uniref:Myb/SANT-like DNA-binding domain-containing protein n=1 Tax=Trapa incisa TaxID=236973 RepID=A0AAN7LA36_9MYRT|nr:hypothetical protein SAY87_016465 [Trapa incisa]
MEDNDETQSGQSRFPSLPPDTTENGQILVDLDCASFVRVAPLQGSLNAVAFSAQNLPLPAAGGGGGGRDDCWSDGSTELLIGAWGKRYLEMKRGNLKEKHWKEVAHIVSQGGGRARTHVQCKYRIDTVKRKYKLEKMEVATGRGPTKWTFFDTMDRLIGPVKAQNLTNAIPGPDKPRRPLPPVNAAERPLRSQQQHHLRAATSSDSDTESDKLAKSPSMDRKRGAVEGRGKGLEEVKRAVKKLVEVYERAETMKMMQEMELEKQRMRLAKETELEMMQLLAKTQAEIASMRRPRRWHEQKKGSGNGSNRN